MKEQRKEVVGQPVGELTGSVKRVRKWFGGWLLGCMCLPVGELVRVHDKFVKSDAKATPDDAWWAQLCAGAHDKDFQRSIVYFE